MARAISTSSAPQQAEGQAYAGDTEKGCLNCILEQRTIFIEISDDVEQKAEGFVEKGLRAFDATHLASAVSGQANYFCSCDDQLLRIGKNLDTGLTVVVNPLELLERITQ